MKAKQWIALALTTVLSLGSVSTIPAATKNREELAAKGRSVYPSYFSLVDEGLVTPVKDQSPFGTCWAFGSISTLETAVLNELGMTYEEAVTTGGAIQALTDLSEKHLAWFTYQGVPASVDPSQAGEGMIIKDLELEPAEAYNKGGYDIYSTAFLANCGGPATEEAFPYEGKTGLRAWEYTEAHKQEIIDDMIRDGYSPEEAEKNYNVLLENYKRSNEPAYEDDWTLDPNSYMVDSPITIENGNFLPSPIMMDEDYNYLGLDVSSVEAVKRELYSGHSVTMGYCHSTEFYNTETCAEYCPDRMWGNHIVSIVGWDDNFKKENFKVDSFEYDDVLPEGDGAWIVKNSWGHYHDYDPDEEDGELQPSQWGVNDSGYFYLSYYDRSIRGLESVDISLDLEGNTKETVHQYDYCILDSYDGSESKSKVSTANVFKTKGNERITALATRSHAQNSRIKMDVYLLNENPTDPMDGRLLTTVNESFLCKGYHRVNLDEAVYVPASSSYSVIVTEMILYNDKGVTYIKGEDVAVCPTEEGYEDIQDLVEYKRIVVNPGESFFYENGYWTDLADNYKYELQADSLDKIFKRKVDDEFARRYFGMSLAKARKFGVKCADNYCIKSFTVDAPEYKPEPDPPTKVVVGKCYTAGTGADTASYQVIRKGDYPAVKYRGSESALVGSNVTIPARVTLPDNIEYEVIGISQNAFAKTPGVKKLTIRSPFLIIDETGGCLLSSNVKTVIIKLGSKSYNKDYRKYYTPIFKKKHSGKKVKLK